MKILLIMPLSSSFDSVINAKSAEWKEKINRQAGIKTVSCVYPTGILSIASYIRKYIPDSEIKILDFNAEINNYALMHKDGLSSVSREDFWSYCLELLGNFTPELIAVSFLFCSNYRDMEPLAQFLRPLYPEIPLVCGGHLPSAIYRTVFEQNSCFNAVAFSEGEIPMYELCCHIKTGDWKTFIEEDNAWITAKKLNTQANFTPERKLVENLDEIPCFDLSMLVSPDAYRNFTDKFLFIIEPRNDLKDMVMFTTRGCPGRCVFCASQNVHGHKIRQYSVERVKKDIVEYNRKYGINHFVFYDDHFLSNRTRAMEILDFIAENNWYAEVPNPAFFSIDADVASSMKNAGVNEVLLSIESGNENTLRNIIHKAADLTRAEQAVQHLHNAGIYAATNILIGMPGETHDSIEEGFNYLKNSSVNWYQCFVTAPLPGSRLWDICEQNGYFVNDNVFDMDFKKCVIQTPDFTPEYIEKKVYEMNLYLNFINNYDMRTGNYKQALHMFERVIFNVIDTHAVAYYCSSQCCDKLGLEEKRRNYLEKYFEMIDKFTFWKEWAEFLNLPLHK